LTNACTGLENASAPGARATRGDQRSADGSAICLRCYRQPSDRCDECGELRRMASRKSGRPLCESCYRRVGNAGGRAATAGGCAGSQRERPKRTPTSARPAGGSRSRSAAGAATKACATVIRQGKSLCLRCRLDDKVSQAQSGPDGMVPPQLLPVRDAVLAVENSTSGHVWLSGSAHA